MSIWHGSHFPTLLFRAFNRLVPGRLGVQAMRLQPRQLTSACIAEIGEQIDCITLKEIADFLGCGSRQLRSAGCACACPRP